MKKLRRLVISMMVFLISLTILSGNLIAVWAADFPANGTITINALPSKGTVGDEIDLTGVGAGLELVVKDPLGNDVTLTGDKFTATKAGNYIVNIYGTEVFYEGFKINITVDNAQINIPNNGAEITSYISTKTAIRIPEAEMVVWDEENSNLVDDEATETANNDYTITYEITNPAGIKTVVVPVEGYATYNGVASDNNLELSGSYLVRYKATKGTIVKTSDFTVNMQDGFEDTEKPGLTVNNVPNTAPQKVKLNLPIASANDNKDEKIHITVSVKDPDGLEVKAVNDSDEKNLVQLADTVKFDNSKVTSFYPWTTGPYNVEYTATDDSGNFTASNYVINVSDTKAPVIELDNDAIPETWGIIVENASGVLTGNNKLLKIPAPDVWDNVTPKADIAVYFSVQNSSSQTIFNSLLDTQPSLNKDGFVTLPTDADDNYYIDFDKLDTKTDTFTFKFTARDKDANGKLKNTSYKSFNVKIVESFKDIDAPLIQTANMPQYILVGDKFTEPTITVYDKAVDGQSSKVNLTKTYTLIPTVGNEVTFDFEEESYFIPEVEGEIRITINANDSVGNTASILTNVVYVYSEETSTPAPTFAPESTMLDTDSEGNVTAQSLYSIVALNPVQRTVYYNNSNSNKVTLGNIIIESSTAANDFLGYEVIVREPKILNVGGVDYKGVGQRLNTTVQSYLVNDTADSNYKLVIEKISFEVKTEGFHSITIRAYNMAGASTITSFVFEVKKESGTAPIGFNGKKGIAPIAYNTIIPSTLELGEAYALPQRDFANDYNYDFKEITGPAYEIKGNIFTPKAVGQYTITLAERAVGLAIGDKSEATSEEAKVKYTFNCVDTKTPVFSVLGEMPSYVVKDGNVVIPDVSVIDNNAVNNFSVKVTDKNGQIVSLDTVDGKQQFKAAVDGVYTITYTVYDTSNTATYTITVRAGDLISPRIIDVSAITPNNLKFEQGAKFYAAEILKENVDDNITNSDNLSITRVLVNLNGDIINTEKDDDNKDYFLLSAAGTYTLTYTVEDEAGNIYEKEFVLTVTGKGKSPINYQILSTILIITAIVLIVGVGVYFFRFRKIKEKDKK